MKNAFVLLVASFVIFSCNKLKETPDLYGTWGASESITDAHFLVISEDCSGHPLENYCSGSGDNALKVKLKDDALKFQLNGSTRYRYIITTYPTVATSIIPFEIPVGCIPVTYVTDTIFPGETYMLLNDDIYLKKKP